MSYTRVVIIGIGICLVFAAGTAAARRSDAASGPRIGFPLGDSLPDVTLTGLDGRAVNLRRRLGGHPALIYIFGPSECASCSNLALEFKVAQNEVSGLRTLLIGSGARPGVFAPLIRDIGLTDVALVDSARTLLAALRVQREPLVLLADSTGRILLADTRGASRAAQFPMGHVLRGLKALLVPASQTERSSPSPDFSQ